MKISASIYSDKKRNLEEVVLDLVAHEVDLLHVDCNDDLSVFDDIKKIRTLCDTPIDLHIITESPEKYYNLLIENPVEYVTFQYENLKAPLTIPAEVSGKKGLAIITPTDHTVFEAYVDFDFILFMATIPGQSGGAFATENFKKIRSFRKKYPGKSIHVDGGVNPEVSFVLRNMGVTSSVSGSYLFKSESVGNALMNLTKREIESNFSVADFMIPISEGPTVQENQISLGSVLKSIDQGKLGFTIITGEDNRFKGLISNADIRKGLLQSLDNLDAMDLNAVINREPVSVDQTATVFEMLQTIKQSRFPILYLPVLNKSGFAVGIVTFVNLIKGEL